MRIVKYGHQDPRIVLAGQRCRRPVHHPHHLKFVAIHLDPLADRIFIGHQLFLHVRADHHNRHVVEALLIGEEAAGLHGGAARGIALFRAAHLNVVQIVALVLGGMQAARGKQIRANMLHSRTALRDGSGIIQRERLAAPLFASGIAHRGGLGDDHRIRPETAQEVGDRAIQARDDRADADHGAGADDHAEHGQERPHLVRAYRVQRQAHSRDQPIRGSFLRPQRFDGIQLRRPLRRVDAEEQTHHRRQRHTHKYRRHRH